MPDTWEKALKAYSYPVNLADFADKHKYPGFFEHSVDGGLASTREFQNRFRENAPKHLAAWFEVVYWKYYFIPNRMKRDGATRSIIRNIRQSGVTANELWKSCHAFTESGKFSDFREFRNKVVSPDGTAVIVPATFPAFLDPERFPMVDTHVTNWVRKNGSRHNYKICGGPTLLEAMNLSSQYIPLSEKWEFMVSWIRWCRFTASTLTKLSELNRSARDVEMAIFTVQRNKQNGRTLRPLCKHATIQDDFETI